MIYNITPVAKPRMTQRDKWLNPPRKCVADYRFFCDVVRLRKVKLPVSGAIIIFYMPAPKSWSLKKKKEMIGKPHTQRPDWDNLGKALSDAVYGEDCVIWDIHIRKIWALIGAIEIIEERG